MNWSGNDIIELQMKFLKKIFKSLNNYSYPTSKKSMLQIVIKKFNLFNKFFRLRNSELF